MNSETGTQSKDVLKVKTQLNYNYDLPRDSQILFWLQDTLHRVYPHSAPEGSAEIELLSARNATISFQACLNNQGLLPVRVECEIESDNSFEVRIRRVGWVPQNYLTHNTPQSDLEGIEHIPGLVPDPLFPETSAKVGPLANQAFWITIRVPENMETGMYALKVKFTSPVLSKEVALIANMDVRPTIIRQRENFPVTHWWYPECIYDWHAIDPLGEEFFDKAKPYLHNLFDHGNDVLFLPLLNYRKEFMKRPPQLLKVWEIETGVYKFDWELVRKVVRMAKEIGFKYYEWSHFWAYSHAKEHAASASTPTRIYTERNGKLDTLFPEDTDATGEVFKHYMDQFVPEFKQFLADEEILDNSLFHICDEPTDNPADIENYRKAREFLLQIDPSVKVMDAVLGDAYLDQGLTDYPVPLADRAVKFLQKQIPHWTYYCCGPLGPYINRFLDTPLVKIRMQGWIFYHLRTLGFLHWGYNYWYIQKGNAAEQEYGLDSQILANVFFDASAGYVYPFGDPFVVYPGEDGPIDSIRWEVFAESLQDYALLQTLGINPDDELLQAIKDYGEFPKTDQWIKQALQKLLKNSAD